jgi:hypothetical protein
MAIRHSVLAGIIMAMVFLLIATAFYPGGSQYDPAAPGFDWRHNYLSNLLNPISVNGLENTARPWAVTGMLLLCLAVALFFVRFSKKIPNNSAKVIKYAGAGAMAAAVFTATPYHDIAVMVSGTLLLLSLFYITVFVFISKLHLLKVLSVVCLLLMYGMNYIYYSQNGLEYLPTMQKVSMVMNLSWFLALEYFSENRDFVKNMAVS